MIATNRNSTLDVAAALEVGASFVDMLLAEQQAPMAIERFARRAADARHSSARYRELLPLTPLEAGKQFAFTVDLDACSGCKACVTACHQLNGLQDDEAWREVGMLIDAAAPESMSRFVTSACHHCIDPGCLRGCPTRAYEKDPTTGIVRHLDDQCFGCQYCTMTCPYNVPQYRPSLGIVRKCDMCRQRLSAGEAPGCVQACPNRAISISIVDVEDSLESARKGEFLPDSPDPSLTIPTTRFRSADPERLSTLREADGMRDAPQHVAGSLVAMLVATQFAVGLSAISWALSALSPNWADAAHASTMTGAACIGIVGVHLALLHLGRPALAYKAWLGWRTSWLSREAIAFGVWMPIAALTAVDALGIFALGPDVRFIAGALCSIVGIASATCSAMIYAATGRPWWSALRTLSRFGLSALLLGFSFAAVAATTTDSQVAASLGFAACLTAIVKLALECEPFYATWHSNSGRTIRRSAKLILGPFRSMWLARCACAGAAGVLSISSNSFFGFATAAAMFFVGELLERSLFFGAVVPPRMPRSITT